MVDVACVVGPSLPLAEADASGLTARRGLGSLLVAGERTCDSNEGPGCETVEAAALEEPDSCLLPLIGVIKDEGSIKLLMAT